MLHGEVHGALEALDAGVDHLPRQPPERLLDFHVEVGVVQVVVPEPCWIESPDHTHAADPKRTTSQIKGTGRKNDEIQREPRRGSRAISDPGLPYFLRREETACMWRRASGLRRGFTSQFASAFIIDDMVVGAGNLFLVFCGGGGGGGTRLSFRPSASSLLGQGRSGAHRWECVVAWTRSRAGAFGN